MGNVQEDGEIFVTVADKLLNDELGLRAVPVVHGMSCPKVTHTGGDGYLHAESDDGPYSVDGVPYCGRCHVYLPAQG